MLKNKFTPLSPQYKIPKEAKIAVVALSENSVWLKKNENSALSIPHINDLDFELKDFLLVGKLNSTYFITIKSPKKIIPGAKLKLLSVRDAFLLLTEGEQIAVGRSKELIFWRDTQRHCGVCGATLTQAKVECSLSCNECGKIFFPNLAPAIIVGISRGKELLLAHNRNFRPGMYSLIAGYVEAGENLEQTVEREIMEEIAIEVKNIKYFGSQSWPFPNSLMVGFTAEYASGVVTPDGQEIIDANWYSPNNLPDIPAHGSISRQIIDTQVKQIIEQ